MAGTKPGSDLASLRADAVRRQAARNAEVITRMAQKLSADIAALEKRKSHRIETFPAYKDARAAYMEIRGLVDTIQDRSPGAADFLPRNFAQWLVRAKLKAISVFSEISHRFVQDPPITLTQSFGAWDVLNAERRNWSEVLDYFDMMMFEAGIDDKTADVLDATRTQIEQILSMIDRLLETSPPPLTEFE